MVDINIINAGTAKVGPYSHAIKADNLIFVSGQISESGLTTIESQTLSVLGKIKEILEIAGSNISNVLKVTIFLKEMKEIDQMNQTYEKFFKQNGVHEKFPARTTVEVSNLPRSDLKIEIDVIATI